MLPVECIHKPRLHITGIAYWLRLCNNNFDFLLGFRIRNSSTVSYLTTINSSRQTKPAKIFLVMATWFYPSLSHRQFFMFLVVVLMMSEKQIVFYLDFGSLRRKQHVIAH